MEPLQQQLDKHEDKQSDERLAQALGISPEELHQLDYHATPISSGDIVTSYEYRFSDKSSPEVLSKISGLSDDNTIQLGVYDLEEPPGK